MIAAGVGEQAGAADALDDPEDDQVVAPARPVIQSTASSSEATV